MKMKSKFFFTSFENVPLIFVDILGTRGTLWLILDTGVWVNHNGPAVSNIRGALDAGGYSDGLEQVLYTQNEGCDRTLGGGRGDLDWKTVSIVR